MKKKACSIPKLALLAMLLLACLPPAVVLVYALTERWDGLLPQGPTWQWLIDVGQDPRSQKAVAQTLWLSLQSALLAVLLGGTASVMAYLSAAKSPGLLRLLDLLALLPFAIPPVVLAINALELFVGRWGAYFNLPFIYVLLVTPLLFPLVHKTLIASLQQLDAAGLLEAGRTLGASDGYLLRRVLLPLLAPALLAALLLSWTGAAMEFAIANLLLGGTVELLQPMLNSMRGVNGHQSAALIVLSFAVVMLLGLVVQGMSWTSKKKN